MEDIFNFNGQKIDLIFQNLLLNVHAFVINYILRPCVASTTIINFISKDKQYFPCVQRLDDLIKVCGIQFYSYCIVLQIQI